MAEIVSPLPGIFYRKPNPSQPNFVEEGDRVEKGQVIGLIEVMKQFTEITSEYSGTLTSFEVENEDELTPGAVVAQVEED